MRGRSQRIYRFFIRMAYAFLILFGGYGTAWAASDDEIPFPTPNRTITTTIDVQEHTWWGVRWSDNEILCELQVDHEGLPTGSEIYYGCGDEVFEEWQESSPCEAAASSGDTRQCSGLYLYFVGSEMVEREVQEELPPAEAWISLSGCKQFLYGYRCSGTPFIEIIAEEPLPFESITKIYLAMGGELYTCEQDHCTFPITQEFAEGESIGFWADSSFGDTTVLNEALLRSVRLEEIEQPAQDSWHVDILSTQWLGVPPQACALEWGAFPPIDDLPEWLKTPEDPAELATDEPYELLTGRLIRWGFVDVEACPNDGLLANGRASNCGVSAARPFVDEWQDRFDERILKVANDVDVPAMLIKRVFAQESQFWPGEFPEVKEYGLGQLHAQGGDALLLLNQSFYSDFCPLVLSAETCEDPYHELDAEFQELLRGALTIQANVICPECPGGIDLARADLSVDLFGQILKANCIQVGGLMYNITYRQAGFESSYEDLWKFVLANYNAGPGCLEEAITIVLYEGLRLEWPHVARALGEIENCEGALDYVSRVTGE